MAFPTTSVIETFTAANATLVASLTNWTDFNGVGANAPAVLSNAASTVGGTGSYVGAYKDTPTFGPDSEAYCTCSEAGTYFGVYVRVVDPLTSADGYKAGWSTDAGGTITLELVTNGSTVSTLASTAGVGSPTAGHKLGLEAIGSTLKVYRDTGGGWTEVLSDTDTTYNVAGVIGFDMFDSTAISIDDFGGGTVAGGTDYTGNVAGAAAGSASGPTPGVNARPFINISVS